MDHYALNRNARSTCRCFFIFLKTFYRWKNRLVPYELTTLSFTDIIGQENATPGRRSCPGPGNGSVKSLDKLRLRYKIIIENDFQYH
jgi:hypothetical protein